MLGATIFTVGSNNSAHDICVNLWENEADVTMVQRSPTLVVRSETLQTMGDRTAEVAADGVISQQRITIKGLGGHLLIAQALPRQPFDRHQRVDNRRGVEPR